MVKTAVLVSGGGANLQAIIDANIFGEIENFELTAVISSDPNAYALRRAEFSKIPAYTVDLDIFPNNASFTEAILKKLRDLDIELVVMAGFTPDLTPVFLEKYSDKVITVFPSLVPMFDGENGLQVHELVLKRGVRVTGATSCILSTEHVDGRIILQKTVDVLPNDTPATLQRRVMEKAEWEILPRSISLYCSGKLSGNGKVITIAEEKDASDEA